MTSDILREYAARNRAIKKIVEAKYGRGNVSVTGSKGTGQGWTIIRVYHDGPEIDIGLTVFELLLDADMPTCQVNVYQHIPAKVRQ